MDIDYTDNLTGTARFTWEGADGEWDIQVDLPLVLHWAASRLDRDEDVTMDDVQILGVTVSRDGCWKALEHVLLPPIRERLSLRDEIAEWLNDNWDSLSDLEPRHQSAAEYQESEQLVEYRQRLEGGAA